MADLKQELAQIQGRLAALKTDCLAKMGEDGGDGWLMTVISNSSNDAIADPLSSASASVYRLFIS